MNVIILGGNSIKNQEWVLEVARHLKAKFHTVYPHIYEHWQSGSNFIDLDHEAKALRKADVFNGEYLVIAKSVGCVLTLKLTSEYSLNPAACVLLGFPLAVIQQADAWPVSDWLANLKCKTTFVQNDEDPVGSHEEVQAYLAEYGLQGKEVLAWKGATHDYLDFDEIVKISALLTASPEHQ